MSVLHRMSCSRLFRALAACCRRGLVAAALMAGALPALAAPDAHAVTGGQNSTTTAFGFVAEVRNTAVGGLCTGSLVHPSWVLTAVHCSVPTSTGDMTVRVGNNTSASGGEVRRITRIVAHPSYAGGANDVALLELSSPITNVKPVPIAPASVSYLWNGNGEMAGYDRGVTVGWGTNSAGTLPSTLQWKSLDIREPQPDSTGLRRLVVGAGPCQGDSGGPLLVTYNGQYMQAGVLKAANCTNSGWYSEVGAGSNRDWITSQMTKLPYTFFGAKDWDRDGHQDLIARQEATGDLILFPGQSRRGYSYASTVKIGNGWQGYTPFGVTDWDRDGHQDIIVRHDATGDMWLYPGQSRRGYSSQGRVLIGNGYRGYTPFGATDWDHDGHQDLLVRKDSNGTLYLHPGESRRGYSSQGSFPIGSGWNAYTPFGLADWDRDGHQDIVARENDGGTNLWLYSGQSRRAVSTTPRVRIGNGWQGYTPFGIADWDRDGHQDIITRHDATQNLWLYAGESRRGYTSTPRVQIGNGW